MSKSPFKDYTAILQQSRTKKKQDQRLIPQTKHRQRYTEISRKYPTNQFYDSHVKLDIALKHNAQLLSQNATLSQMVNSLRIQLRNSEDDIIILKRNQQDFLKNSAKQRQNLIMEAQIKSSNHQSDLKRLFDEISTLHEQKNNLEIQKSKQIQTIKGEFQRSLLTQMQNLKNIQSNAKELYEVQIQNLKQQLKKQEYEIENVKALERLEKNRLKDQISSAQNEMKHLKQKYEIDLKELQQEYQKQKISQKRRLQQQKQIQANSQNLKVKKLKKQLLQKAHDLQIVNKRMYNQQQTYNMQSITFKKDKQNLLAELTNNEINYKTILIKEKTKIEELSRLQIQNLTQLFETNIDQLQSEVNRLRLLIDCKTQEIKESYEENQKLKDSFTKQIDWYKNQNQYIKERLQKIEVQHKQELQATKVKLAQLIESNTQQISQYFQKQLANLTIHNREMLNLNKDLKQRIYKLIQDNDEMRKTFEIETSKFKARIQDYKIKLASITLQHKEHVGSLVSKVEMTSQTLIREGDSKERVKAFYEEERRKYQALSNQKDQQITELVASIQSIKQLHEDEIRAAKTEKDQLTGVIQKLEEEKRAIKQKLEQELLSKDEKIRSIKYDNQKQIQEIRELQNKLAESQKQILKLKKALDHMNVVNQSLGQQLGLKKGFIETLQLQSNAAIEEEKNKLRVVMGSHEVSLRDYFQEQLKSKNKDIDSLKNKLTEKQQDIRQLIIKYNALEKRFDMAMEAQDKIRQFEQKIRKLGLDNNLVKNMAELFQKKV